MKDDEAMKVLMAGWKAKVIGWTVGVILVGLLLGAACLGTLR